MGRALKCNSGAKRQRHWKSWKYFVKAHNIPFPLLSPRNLRLKLHTATLLTFAVTIRTGKYGLKHQVPVQSVSKALCWVMILQYIHHIYPFTKWSIIIIGWLISSNGSPNYLPQCWLNGPCIWLEETTLFVMVGNIFPQVGNQSHN